MTRDFTEEEQFDRAKFVLLLFGVVLFLVSGLFSCNELNYAVRGKVAAATSVKKIQTRDGSKNGPMVYEVTYEFPDVDGTVRREIDNVPLEWQFPTGGPQMIQFIPKSADSSRLLGHRRLVFVYAFLLSFIPIGIGGYKFWRFYRS